MNTSKISKGKLFTGFFAALLLIVLAAQCLILASKLGQTTDETFYNGSGYAMVRYNNYDILGEHPPLIMQWASLPLLAIQPSFPIHNLVYLGDQPAGGVDISKTGSRFLYEMGNNPYQILFLERSAIVILTLLLGIIIFYWAYLLFGEGGALLSFALTVFCPTLIAHGSLFTTDLGATFFIFLSCLLYYRYIEKPTLRGLLLCGIVSGFAILSKISALILAPISVLLFLCSAFLEKNAFETIDLKKLFPPFSIYAILLFVSALGQKTVLSTLGPLCLFVVALTVEARQDKIKQVGRLILVAGAVAILVSSSLISKKMGLKIGVLLLAWNLSAFIAFPYILRKSERLSGWVWAFSLIWITAGYVIILDHTDFIYTWARLKPFAHYIRTFNIALDHTQSYHQVCDAGSWISCDWRYFVQILAVKTSFVTLGLSILGLFLLVLSSVSWKKKICLLIPPALFLVSASFANHIRIGVRHVLPLYPFLLLFSGALVPAISQIGSARIRRSLWGIVIILICYNAFHALQQFPYYISYFNEAIGTMERGAMLTSDSNVDWGEDNKTLAEFVKAKGIPFIRIFSRFANAAEYDYHGIHWKWMEPGDFIHPPPGFYALDLETLQDQQKQPESWFGSKTPKFHAGKIFSIFEVPEK